MRPRVFVPDLGQDSERLSVPIGEAEHLVRVLRIRPGQTVSAFDGKGKELQARVETAGRRGVTLRAIGSVIPVPETVVRITLAQAVLKGDKMDAVVRDAVMLGVAEVQPIVADRSEISPASLKRSHRLDRWERIALASVKQSGRAVVPPVRAALSSRDFLNAGAPDLSVMLVEPSAGRDAVRPAGTLASLSRPERSWVLIGPEGGWTSEEIELARARGFRLVSLGARTLRADAVPVVILAILLFLWGEL